MTNKLISLKNEFEYFISDNLKNAVNDIIFIAEKLDIKLYLIGGIVRDLILNIQIKDIDITMEGNAIFFCRELEKNLDCKIISIQENLKTVKVEFEPGVIIDFASTREEVYIKKGFLPIAENFGCSLKNDVKRRDFTINTLAVSLYKKEKFSLIDYFNGYDDIINKKIKILHNDSFIDDPSRIVRAIKFQLRFGFDIEQNTNNLMYEYLNNVKKDIPFERIKNELKQYFSIKNKDVYNNIVQKKVYNLISDNPFIDFNYSDLSKIKSFFNEQNLWQIYFSLLLINSDFSNPRLSLTRTEKKTLKEAKELISNFPLDINNNVQIYNSLINKSELSPIIYYIITKDNAVLKFYENLKNIKLLITGDDLINLGIKPSPYFSKLFNIILNEKLNGRLNTKEQELSYIKNFYFNNNLQI